MAFSVALVAGERRRVLQGWSLGLISQRQYRGLRYVLLALHDNGRTGSGEGLRVGKVLLAVSQPSREAVLDGNKSKHRQQSTRLNGC